MTNVDNEDILNVKIAVDAVSIPIYNNFQWRHRNQVLQTNLTRYTMASIETLIPTDIYGQLVRISAYRFTLAFTAFQIENYGEYSIVISNKNGTSICSANEQQKSKFSFIYCISTYSYVFSNDFKFKNINICRFELVVSRYNTTLRLTIF